MQFNEKQLVGMHNNKNTDTTRCRINYRINSIPVLIINLIL